MALKTAVMTIASRNYEPYVRTLMQSLAESNPGYRRYFFLADEKDASVSEDLFTVVEAAELEIPNFVDMTIRYDVMEFNTAIKPFAIEWLFNHTDVDCVIYLDPDIFVYRELSELNRLLEKGASVVVTPHIMRPLEDRKKPNDHHMLQAGVFNLGFIAVSNTPEARDFVAWWGRRLQTMCHAEPEKNLFTDQRWVDLAPCFLAELAVLRNPAYNVAYWNLMQRPPSIKKGKLYADGVELAFFHFSGLDYRHPLVVSKHQTRLTWDDLGEYQTLFKAYRQRLADNGWGTRRSAEYAYDRLGDLRLNSITRLLYRDRFPDISDAPLDEEALLALCNESAETPGSGDVEITRIMRCIYDYRPDLRSAFSLEHPDGRRGFRDWYVRSAQREYGLDERVMPTEARASSDAVSDRSSSSHPNAGKPLLFRMWRKSRRWLLDRVAA